ncbi:MAG: class I SAM-dependent methyltransferase, partial [Sphingomicrobium sp.]
MMKELEELAMASTDAAFGGSIPALYDRNLGPLLFQPYADEVASRIAKAKPRRILETAAGTGIVTEAIRRALPDAEIVATDLNQAMLDMAAAARHLTGVEYQQADALDLPFDEDSFDLVVCQFGVMFYPDKVRGNAEAHRVLRKGGRYLLVIWDQLDRNPASQLIHDAVATVFPDDPPLFIQRAPFGYADPAQIEQDLLEAGFTDIEFETVPLQSHRSSPREAAVGMVQGSPLRGEIEQRDPDRMGAATDAAAHALEALVKGGVFDSELSAHIV